MMRVMLLVSFEHSRLNNSSALRTISIHFTSSVYTYKNLHIIRAHRVRNWFFLQHSKIVFAIFDHESQIFAI